MTCRSWLLALLLALPLALVATPAATADPGPRFTPGAPGVGDPYFPRDGNGGYDVVRYLLDVGYRPRSDRLVGRASIVARATQNLSRLNLDLDGLRVWSVRLDGRRAQWRRRAEELIVTPRRGIRDGHRFRVVVRYAGVPRTLPDGSGFFHTDDGAVVLGEPKVADTWFPVNDHPIDKAAFTVRITVPAGLEAVSNGVLAGRRTRAGLTTWTWRAREPMASYLAMMAIGEFDLDAYRTGGIRFWDALDPDLSATPAPRTGDRFALSLASNLSFKRLSRTISVPPQGAEVSFSMARDTEEPWDFAFVEARTAGQGDWTTLPDLNGHTRQDTGFSCPFWLTLHPFLEHYQSAAGGDACEPTGTTGEWWAATGSTGTAFERWRVDLTPYAGSDVDLSISYASDDVIQGMGLFVDDVSVSTGEGTTSFEDDADPWDGWAASGPPAGSQPNENNWVLGDENDAPPNQGDIARGSFARQPEVIDFLAGILGPYPFSAGGGVVDDLTELGFALETQTRPVYARGFFVSPEFGDSVVVHELAHQWAGDHLALQRWRHIWLNEGFATYAEWLWSEREGLATAQQIFDDVAAIPAGDSFWALRIGDPGPDSLFDGAVYNRGAMTLHALRGRVGDPAFFRILRRWVATQAGGHVTTGEFVALAERISGRQLDRFFRTWLFTPRKPDGLAPSARNAAPVPWWLGSREVATRTSRAR